MTKNNLNHTINQWCWKGKPEPGEFEDDDFKEDKKALDDQGEDERTNSLFPP